jgi:predicted metal-dependent HD superfamily phosphohydrolase
MTITKQTVVEEIASYLRHDISLKELAYWFEDTMRDGEFDENEATTISVIATKD